MQPKARFESSQRLFPLAEYSGGIFVRVKVELDLLKAVWHTQQVLL